MPGPYQSALIPMGVERTAPKRSCPTTYFPLATLSWGKRTFSHVLSAHCRDAGVPTRALHPRCIPGNQTLPLIQAQKRPLGCFWLLPKLRIAKKGPRFPRQLLPLLLTFCSVHDELPPPLPLGMTLLLSPLHLKHTQIRFRDS